MSIFKYEQELWNDGYEFVIGVDEVGRGPLAGPVVAVACIYKYCHSRESGNPVKFQRIKDWIPGQARDDKKIKLIRDSKMLSAKQRESLYDFLCEHFYIGIGICDHKTIDKINIHQASFLAMKKALVQLKKEIYKNHNINILDKKHIVLVDGKHKIPNFSLEQKPIINGDAKVKIISAASIIAKLTRDKIMVDMHEDYPEYGFNLHKGYGTKMHLNMIRKYGLCDIHRRSFKPCNLAPLFFSQKKSGRKEKGRPSS